MSNKLGNKLIPGGELSFMPAGTYTAKDGSIRPSPAKVWVSFGKVSTMYRYDQLKALVETIMGDADIKETIGVSI